MKKKGFTLIELLVVIAIIAMLMAILMPALGRVRRLAQRLVCGTNLKGLGTATMVYANENDEEYPIAGGKGANVWAKKDAQHDYWDTQSPAWATINEMTVSSCLYLLVREADVSPKQFVCGSSDQKAFEGLNEEQQNTTDPLDITELWDFGGSDTSEKPRDYVSYSYQLPYEDANGDKFPLSVSDSAGMVIMADKNPWFDPKLTENAGTADDYMSYVTNVNADLKDWDAVEKWQIQIGNSNAHLREGQNVLYNDGHVAFEKRPDVGVRNDNIYVQRQGKDTFTEDQIRQGSGRATIGTGNGVDIKSEDDNVLVSDDQR